MITWDSLRELQTKVFAERGGVNVQCSKFQQVLLERCTLVGKVSRGGWRRVIADCESIVMLIEGAVGQA